MALLGYASESDVVMVMTFHGLNNRADDNYDAINDSDLMTWALETAEAKLLFYVGQDYVLSTLVGNAWVRWATSVIASTFFTRRGGDNTPAGLQREYDEIMELLEMVLAGKSKIPGIVQPGNFGGISYTNYEMDWRRRFPISRPVLQDSTGSITSTLPRKSLDLFRLDVY